MSNRFPLTAVLGAILGASLFGVTLDGQRAAAAPNAGAAASGSIARTPWGDPDLQGIFTTDDEVRVPVERPRELGTRAVLSEEEMAARLREVARRARDDRNDRTKLAEDQTGDGPEHWYEQGKTISRRTSLIIDPPDGRLPPLTPDGEKRLADQRTRGSFAKRLWEGPEALDLRDRCITRGVPNTWFPSAYNNGFQIVQSPGYVAILQERLHEARIIPLDGRPHVPSSMRQWIGDSRGRWEGDTLVVDTTNFSPTSNFRGSSETLHLIERFTRIDAGTLEYSITIDDPTTWTKPWTAMIPLRKTEEQVFEYACHEGNIEMAAILSGARAEEQAARRGR